MGYRLNRLDEPIFMAGPKPMRTEFGIYPRLESCAPFESFSGKKKTKPHFFWARNIRPRPQDPEMGPPSYLPSGLPETIGLNILPYCIGDRYLVGRCRKLEKLNNIKKFIRFPKGTSLKGH